MKNVRMPASTHTNAMLPASIASGSKWRKAEPKRAPAANATRAKTLFAFFIKSAPIREIRLTAITESKI
jgi:hypothetical protein